MANPADPSSAGWMNQAATGDTEQGGGPASASALAVPALPGSGTASAPFPATTIVKIVPGAATVSNVTVNSTSLGTHLDNVVVTAGSTLKVTWTGGTPTIVPKQWATLKNASDVCPARTA